MQLKAAGWFTLISAMIATIGCGPSASRKGAASPSVLNTGWAADACETFPAAAASKASGLVISKTQLSLQSPAGAPAIGSTCSYATANYSSQFTVLLRQDTTGNQTVESQIVGLTGNPEMTGAMEPVSMQVGKAFWAPSLKTLSYIPDAARMIVVAPPGSAGLDRVPDKELQSRAVGIASGVPL